MRSLVVWLAVNVQLCAQEPLAWPCPKKHLGKNPQEEIGPYAQYVKQIIKDNSSLLISQLYQIDQVKNKVEQKALEASLAADDVKKALSGVKAGLQGKERIGKVIDRINYGGERALYAHVKAMECSRLGSKLMSVAELGGYAGKPQCLDAMQDKHMFKRQCEEFAGQVVMMKHAIAQIYIKYFEADFPVAEELFPPEEWAKLNVYAERSMELTTIAAEWAASVAQNVRQQEAIVRAVMQDTVKEVEREVVASLRKPRAIAFLEISPTFISIQVGVLISFLLGSGVGFILICHKRATISPFVPSNEI